MSTLRIDLSCKNLTGSEGGQSDPLSSPAAKPTSTLMAKAAKILDVLGPDTNSLSVVKNPQFTHRGLQALVQGMIKRKKSEWDLERLALLNCGLGGDSESWFRLSVP